MEWLIYFGFGYFFAFIGVIPPGLLNLSAAKISYLENRRNAFLFSLGVITTLSLQTYFALLFARYLQSHPEIINNLQIAGLLVFVFLSIYFFFFAKAPTPNSGSVPLKSKKHRYFQGVSLAALNLFPIPYWVFLSITFSALGWFDFSKTFIALCIFGAALGTLTMLVAYAHYFNGFKKKNKTLSLNINFIIGTITTVVAVITLLKIIREWS